MVAADLDRIPGAVVRVSHHHHAVGGRPARIRHDELDLERLNLEAVVVPVAAPLPHEDLLVVSKLVVMRRLEVLAWSGAVGAPVFPVPVAVDFEFEHGEAWARLWGPQYYRPKL